MTVYAHVRVHVRVCVMCVPKLCCHGELFGKGILRATSAEHIKMHFKNQNSSYTHRLCLEGNTKIKVKREYGICGTNGMEWEVKAITLKNALC